MQKTDVVKDETITVHRIRSNDLDAGIFCKVVEIVNLLHQLLTHLLPKNTVLVKARAKHFEIANCCKSFLGS